MLEGQEGFDPFARGPSVCNLTVSGRRSVSNMGLTPNDRNEISEYYK